MNLYVNDNLIIDLDRVVIITKDGDYKLIIDYTVPTEPNKSSSPMNSKTIFYDNKEDCDLIFKDLKKKMRYKK